MKPTLANLRKQASEATELDELSALSDHVAFYISGAKEAALGLGKSVNEIAEILDRARRVGEFIDERARELGSL